MGAPKEDYEKVAPPHSFIHVDDFRTPRHLAEYLDVLDKDDVLYNQYFEWRSRGWFIDTLFFCRLCAMIHLSAETNHATRVDDINGWWQGKQCIYRSPVASWKNFIEDAWGAPRRYNYGNDQAVEMYNDEDNNYHDERKDDEEASKWNQNEEAHEWE